MYYLSCTVINKMKLYFCYRIIEVNGISCIKLPPVDFNKILHELNGHKYQLVVLRKTDSNKNQNDQTVNVRL